MIRSQEPSGWRRSTCTHLLSDGPCSYPSCLPRSGRSALRSGVPDVPAARPQVHGVHLWMDPFGRSTGRLAGDWVATQIGYLRPQRWPGLSC